ncbi:transcriptional regulator [Kluyvera ascorbata]|uniref:winged helix-turn-helix domain-containing protein n=1 Tax=Kluyvera ascorbata TaxID=51288 RepID=UPI00374CF51B
MKYLLANVLVYDNEDGSLTLQNDPDPESQVLTCTAQTILNLLIAHHGMVVERETFLEQVWDERGLRGSSNSLNQYISILRKIFATLVPDSLFIVTVPKVGFMLSADVTIMPLTPLPPPPVLTREKAPRPRKCTAVYAIVTLIVLALCSTAIVWKNRQQQADLYLLEHIGNCPVYTLAPLADVFREQAKKLIAQIQKDGAFSCLNHSIFYAHIQDPLLYGDEGRLVLSQCSQFLGKASACQTLYYYEWQK